MTEEELKRKNRLLRILLYCTKRSCNNCGKVNCENFQRQRIDCCGLWVSYKDYITELEKEKAELKEQLDAIDKAGEHVRQQITDAFRNKKPYWELEKENAELESNFRICEKNADTYYDQLTKAKEIIKKFSEFANNETEYDPEHPQEHTDLWNKLCERAKQFLNSENIIFEDAQAGNSPFDADEVFNKEMKAYTDEK